MTAKEILTRPHKLKIRLRYEMDNLLVLRTLAESCTSHLKIAGGSRQQGQRGGLEDITIRLAEEEKRADEMLSSLSEAEKDAMDLIRKLKDEREKAVLMTRYVQERSWNDVAKACAMGRTTATRFHKEALQKLDRILKEEESVA